MVVVAQTLPTLIRQCKADRRWEERVDAAETLAYLIEVDVHLQNTAAISDQIITTLSEYFRYPGSPPDASLMPTTKVPFDSYMLDKHVLFGLWLCLILVSKWITDSKKMLIIAALVGNVVTSRRPGSSSCHVMTPYRSGMIVIMIMI